MQIKATCLVSLLLGFWLPTHASPSFTGSWEHRGQAHSGIWLKTRQQGNEVRFQLEILRGAPSYSTGWIEGTVGLKNGQGVFRSSEFGECAIAFAFKDRSVRLTHPDMQVACGFGHNVFAEGTLLRKSRVPPEFCREDPRSGDCGSN